MAIVSFLLAIYFASLTIYRSVAVTILTSPDELKSSQYDFVVIGGGTAGLVVATRLTEDPKVRVLVVEAGGRNEGVLNSIVPYFAVQLLGTSSDWNFTTVPQTGLLNRTLPIARGHILGGSSSINRLDYTRGSNDLYDRWANLTGDPGWSWASLEKYYLRSSRLVPPTDGRDTTGDVDPSAHGLGPIQVSLVSLPAELDARVVNTSRLLGGRFDYTQDWNSGNSIGIGHTQCSIGQGVRSSSAVAYLDPLIDSSSRPNLSILINTVVTKLLPSEASHGVPEFKTVELGQVNSSSRFRVSATKEVVLSAGAIGTPHILMLSGIGPKEVLTPLGINTLVDLPSVGQNLTDHPLIQTHFLVNSTKTFDDVLRNETLAQQTFAQWNTTRQGLYAGPSGGTIGFLRLPSDSPLLSKFGDPASGHHSPHIELIFANAFGAVGVSVPATGNFMSISTGVVSPLSRGFITLISSDPFDKPLLNPNFLDNDFDVFAMVQALKDMQSFISTDPWRGIVIGPTGQLVDATTDEQLQLYARNASVSLNHSIGTARMSPFSAEWGVVNPDLLVKGTRGLSVVDASIFPSMPECHTQAPTYIVAERAVDFIKARNGMCTC